MYDYIVVGAGAAGSTIAHKLAKDGGKNVLILEKRAHIGGNCYDRPDEYGILIHEYGPHIFHTSDEEVFRFLSEFTDWYLFGHKVAANVRGEFVPVPFNLNALYKVFDRKKAEKLEKILVWEYGEESRVPIIRLKENSNPEIREIADYVYENIFLHYTMKQWGQTPEEISPDVTERVPVLISHDDRYFQDKYQGMPKEGYTAMFMKMLEHKNITVKTSADCKDYLSFTQDSVLFEGEEFAGKIIYTGALDELFDCEYGRLPYRSLDFQFEHFNQESFQGRSVVNYTVSEEYTRITEFKYLTGQKETNGTTIVKEYPFAYTGSEGEIPYYAILNDANRALYQKYADRIAHFKNIYLLGRLAEYKYYNIDVIIKKALQLAHTIRR